MTAAMQAKRAALREWVARRATDPEDLNAASGLIAAYVAEAVRADRAIRVDVRAPNPLRDLFSSVFGAPGRPR